MKYLNPKYILIYAVKIYKYTISPLLPPACRHYPTCSDYAIGALEKHGFIKGSYFSIVRILRCNPFFKGGYDPVP
jgi:putative membrane protein insertion efficiency factor